MDQQTLGFFSLYADDKLMYFSSENQKHQDAAWVANCPQVRNVNNPKVGIFEWEVSEKNKQTK